MIVLKDGAVSSKASSGEKKLLESESVNVANGRNERF